MSSPGVADDLRERLASPDRSTLRAACDEAVPRLPHEPALRETLLQRLRTGPPHGRFAAAYVLFHAERPGLRLLPALLDALDLDDGDLRWSAVNMLTALGRLQSEVLPVLLHESGAGATPQRRRMALYALRELAPERPETGRAILVALDDTDPEVRRAAFTSLAKLHEPDPGALERTLAVLETDADPRMRRIAATLLPDLLRHHPDGAAAARAALERAAAGEDASLTHSARLALARL